MIWCATSIGDSTNAMSVRALAAPPAYNFLMARGWESKSVSDQIEEQAARKEAARSLPVSPLDIQRRQKRDGLLLARARTAEALEVATHPQRRAMLQEALAHLDAELATLQS